MQLDVLLEEKQQLLQTQEAVKKELGEAVAAQSLQKGQLGK